MARYLGATCKLARRLGTDLSLKSRARPLESKCKLTTRPGQHGGKRPRPSSYALQLTEKQKIRFTFGVGEKQFKLTYNEAARRKGPTGTILLQLLESRLDNIVYRLGFAVTRSEARQLVSHKAILVNNKVVNIPSCIIKPGSIVEIRPKAKNQTRILDAVKLAQSHGFPEWVTVDATKLSGVVQRVPDRSEISQDFNEQLVVELYSKN